MLSGLVTPWRDPRFYASPLTGYGKTIKRYIPHSSYRLVNYVEYERETLYVNVKLFLTRSWLVAQISIILRSRFTKKYLCCQSSVYITALYRPVLSRQMQSRTFHQLSNLEYVAYLLIATKATTHRQPRMGAREICVRILYNFWVLILALFAARSRVNASCAVFVLN